MKKIYILLMILLPVIAGAQITITQSDLPGAGWGYINATDSGYGGSILPGGANQTWNYAGLLNVTQDSLLFLNAAGSQYASTFPAANLVTYNPNDSNYAYFISNSTGLLLNGAVLHQYNNLIAVDNPPEMYLPVPFTYNSTYTGYSRIEIDSVYLGDSSRAVRYTSVNITADGYGSLILPNMTVTNTLRIKKTALLIDSTFVKYLGIWVTLPPTYSQTTDYRWLQNGNGTLLLEIQADSAGQTGRLSSYLLTYVLLGINSVGNRVTVGSAYPNPADDNITFTFKNNTSASKLIIMNALGEVVESYDISGKEIFIVDTKKFANGNYIYSLQSQSDVNANGKFTVMH